MRQRQAWPTDYRLLFSMGLTMFLLAALYLAFLVVLWAAGADFFAVALIAAVMLGIQYFFSDRLVLWSAGAHEVSPEQAPELHAMVERLAAYADLPKPRLAMVESDMPNAFATGRSPSAAVVAVTTGLLRRLDTPELEAVLAHELSHVRTRDVMVMTLASFFAVVAGFILRFAMFGGSGRGRRDRGGSLVVVYLASLAVWVISFFLLRALSRYREFAADRGAAILTGAPSVLASALVKISGTMTRIPERDLREVEGLNTFFIIPAATRESIFEFFATHPRLESRLARLKQLEQEIGGV